jgi:hypothetical protein
MPYLGSNPTSRIKLIRVGTGKGTLSSGEICVKYASRKRAQIDITTNSAILVGSRIF